MFVYVNAKEDRCHLTESNRSSWWMHNETPYQNAICEINIST
jgi:hypothetical protein